MASYSSSVPNSAAWGAKTKFYHPSERAIVPDSNLMDYDDSTSMRIAEDTTRANFGILIEGPDRIPVPLHKKLHAKKKRYLGDTTEIFVRLPKKMRADARGEMVWEVTRMYNRNPIFFNDFPRHPATTPPAMSNAFGTEHYETTNTYAETFLRLLGRVERKPDHDRTIQRSGGKTAFFFVQRSSARLPFLVSLITLIVRARIAERMYLVTASPFSVTHPMPSYIC